MKNPMSKIRDLPYLLTAIATVAMAPQASAQTTAGQAAENMTNQAGNIGKLIVAGGFVGGLVMLATGLMKLKQAAENPQTKYSEGLWRVGVGAALVAIPAFSGMLSESFGIGGNQSITAGGGATF